MGRVVAWRFEADVCPTLDGVEDGLAGSLVGVASEERQPMCPYEGSEQGFVGDWVDGWWGDVKLL